MKDPEVSRMQDPLDVASGSWRWPPRRQVPYGAFCEPMFCLTDNSKIRTSQSSDGKASLEGRLRQGHHVGCPRWREGRTDTPHPG